MVTARDVMAPAPRYLNEADSVAAAAVMMRDLGVGSVPVCRDDGMLAGVVTDRDIVVRCLAAGWDPYSTSARELIDEEVPLVVAADEPIESALLKMAVHHIHRLPVVEDGSLIGVLADADLAQALPDDALDMLFRPLEA